MSKAAHPTRFRDGWRIRWFDHQGHRCSALFANHEEAERALRRRKTEVEEVLAGKRKPAPVDRRFDELCTYWLAHRATHKRSEADDRSIIERHLRPTFGKLLIREVTTEAADAFVRARTALSPKTIKNHIVLLGSMLRLAEELGWLHLRPILHKPQVNPDDETEHRWLKSDDEIERLLDAARAEIVDDEPCSELPFMLYATAVYTGLRAGELAGLRWADVDFDRRTIQVRRSFDGPTKTRSSRRFVPIFDALLPALRAWKLRCPPTDGDFVFPSWNNTMRDPSNRVFRETLHRCLARAGLKPLKRGNKLTPHITFHSLRHTFACHWRLRGGDLDRLIELLGHTTKSMSMLYASLGPHHRPEEFAIFGASPVRGTSKKSA